MLDLNVGGKLFTTSIETLKKVEGSYLSTIDTNQELIFIDRDFTHFQLILNFVRDGDVFLPSECQSLLEIKAEAQFYRLPKLEEKIDVLLAKLDPNVLERRIYRVFEIKKGCSSEVERLANQYAEYGFCHDAIVTVKNGDSFLILSAREVDCSV
ncbi:hypothetical protein P9112_000512 [Eukaryota sp. TZLM1-RC]